ncbi:putative antirepressor [Clostridium paraputrificum]|uniref:ORF6C domain-containing protein n=1 Tax=Clostridium paraputrificum TaxID=29363 RepID=UPI0006C6A144|nr:ORF6C domain-containing protein [Clostridium paraputrificum]CUQ09788.1 putative antirepressor [Clostridium paraputrificum]
MNNQIVKINNTDLSVKEFNEQRVVTFKDIDMLHERVEGTAKRNFNEHKKHLIKDVDYFEVKQSDFQKYEIRTLEIPNRGLTLITESGYLMLVKSLQDDLAWKVQRELVNNYFRVKSGQALNTSKLSKELKAILMLDEKTVEMDNRITNLEERMTIETGSQKVLCDLVNKKVMAVLGGKDTPAYRELGKKVFRQCWNDYKKILDVASYKDTPVKDFDLAKKVIIDWKPNRELELMIMGCNAQIRM